MKVVPEAEREKRAALQQRYGQLLVLLPTNANELDELDADQLDAALADIELISADMMDVNATELAILDELARRP